MSLTFKSAPVAQIVLCAAVTCALAPAACKKPSSGPDLQIVGETEHLRETEAYPASSPYFDGKRVALVAARGETLGIQVLHRGGGKVKLTIEGAAIRSFAVERWVVTRPSTAMYGGSRGTGAYPDGLVEMADAATDPAYFEISVDPAAAPGTRTGELSVGDRKFPVALEIGLAMLPPIDRAPIVWAYEDPRQLGATVAAPNDAERSCIAMFRSYGVLLSPDLPPDAWNVRRDLVAGAAFVPAVIPDEPSAVGDAVHAWIANTKGTAQVPFAIPIDEPRKPEVRAKVRALADAARGAGAGSAFLFAVTDEPHPEYGDTVDLYITLRAKLTDTFRRWTYNGAPPHAGSMVLDAQPPGPRTWGVIGWRYKIAVWYVWDALYWHDRHNRKGQPPRALDPRVDATSFDDGDDHGNLDGVLALPGDAHHGCRPTLRLAQIRRGLEDRALLDLAAHCAPEAAARVASELVPRALGDTPDDATTPAWPTDEATWEAARRKLIDLAACNH